MSNFGQEWEVGQIITRTPYKAGSAYELSKASIGVNIGLRSVNVTLKSDAEENSPLQKEIINYNERFEWMWDQGRFGFGPYGKKLLINIFYVRMIHINRNCVIRCLYFVLL